MRLPNGRRSFNGVWGTTQKIKSQWYCSIKISFRHTVHDWILLADAQWPASLFCTHDSAWWLQMSFNWPLTWDFPMADAHSMERGEQLKRSNLNGIVQWKFCLRHSVHDSQCMTESYWQTLNDKHPFFAPMIRHDGCKCLLIIDLLHETSQWQTLIQRSVGNNSKDQISMVLFN